MEKKIAKPKFVAPMITANSFLKALCKSPEVHRPQTKRASVIKEFIPSFPLKHDSIFRTLESPTVRSQIVIKSPKFTRDISHLKDSLKESKSDSFLPPLQHILPTSPEHLRKYLNANETHSRCNSPGHLCNKEKCLNEFLDRSFDKLETKKSREDHSRINLQLGLPTGKNDISNLKDWYEGMKSAHFNKLVNSPNASLYENFENDLEVMGLVVRAGLKECVRQVKVQSIDRGEVLEELLQNFEFFWKGKNVNIVNTLKMRFKALKQKKQNLKENTKKFENERIENEKKVKTM